MENSKDKNRRRCFQEYQGDISVSQGSHLGQLCFIWFVNRLSMISDNVRVYVDDMKLFLLVRCFQSCIKIQSNLNKLFQVVREELIFP
jgi:hypothetical protein